MLSCFLAQSPSLSACVHALLQQCSAAVLQIVVYVLQLFCSKAMYSAAVLLRSVCALLLVCLATLQLFCMDVLCFVQLCKGVSAEDAELYRLPAEPMVEFSYLNQSGCSSIEGVDDATDFATLKSAMTAVGINHQQQTEVFEVLAGILWLGNIQFTAPTDDSVSVHPGAALSNAAALLQISEVALMNALTSRNIVARGETIVTQLKMEGAMDARDALAKATYAGMLAWIVPWCCPARCMTARSHQPWLDKAMVMGIGIWLCLLHVPLPATACQQDHCHLLSLVVWVHTNNACSTIQKQTLQRFQLKEVCFTVCFCVQCIPYAYMLLPCLIFLA